MKTDKYVIMVVIIFALGAIAENQMVSFSEKMNYDSYNQMEDDYDFLQNDFFDSEEYARPNQADVSTTENTTVAGLSAAPTPPEGYEWVACEKMTAQFLKPEGWYFLEESNEDSTACFITKEQITDATPYFTTGVSVNAVQDASNQLPLSPQQFVSALLDEISVAFDQATPQTTLEPAGSPLYGKASTMRTEESTVYYLNYWNKETDTVYLISFESPTDEWEEAWSEATPILQTLGLNKNY